MCKFHLQIENKKTQQIIHTWKKSNDRPFASNGLGLSLFEGTRERDLKERSVEGEGEKEREGARKD
jgi:hypothetical protein